MSRYIDADEFGRCLQNYRPYVDSGRFNAIQTEVNQVLDCIEYEIEDAPSIEIIRCGECKHNYNTAINHGKMQPRCDFTDYKLTENDFCSRGEREGE